MPCAVIIPARFASTRFPGKPLHIIAGKPLIQHVWVRCRHCRNVTAILIATDDERIAAAARGFGADVRMTTPDHQGGTDRIAEAARSLPEASHVSTIQGDAPLISPRLGDELAARMAADENIGMITTVHPLRDPALMDNPDIVKWVITLGGRALSFSRSR